VTDGQTETDEQTERQTELRRRLRRTENSICFRAEKFKFGEFMFRNESLKQKEVTCVEM